MKHKGTVCEHEHDRNQDVMRAYRLCLSQSPHICISEIVRKISNMPSQRFWVSEERAAIVCSRIQNGDKLERMFPQKREMFNEIYRRVQYIKHHNPVITTLEACTIVVNSPAPKFYMTPLSIRETIYKIKRKWYEKRRHEP